MGFDVTLWGRPQTQRRRFEVFAEMLDLGGKAVLDAGCSRGDFAAYLIEKNVAYKGYVGVDGVEEVVAFARERGLPRSRFVVGDFVKDPGLLKTGSPEVVSISGSLNTMDDATVNVVLEGAWAGCSETLVFNFLSDLATPAAPAQQYPARRLPTLKLLAWAAKKTGDVQMRQDYLGEGHDATILMRKA